MSDLIRRAAVAAGSAAAAVVAVALMGGQVAAASQAPQLVAGTAGVQLTSGLKATGFAGYAVTPSTLVSAKAAIKVPRLSCAASGVTGIAPGVFLTGLDVDISGAFGFLFCENGQATYDAQIAINGTQTVQFTVKPGDTLAVSISSTTGKSSATVRDVTTGLSKTVSGTSDNNTQALIGDAGAYFSGVPGPVSGVPKFKSYPVSSASVGGRALGSVHPVRVERVKGKIVQLVPTAITGGNAFKVVFKHT